MVATSFRIKRRESGKRTAVRNRKWQRLGYPPVLSFPDTTFPDSRSPFARHRLMKHFFQSCHRLAGTVTGCRGTIDLGRSILVEPHRKFGSRAWLKTDERRERRHFAT